MDLDNFAPHNADPLMERLAEQYSALTARTDELVDALPRVPDKIDERARWLARIRSILIVRFRLAGEDAAFLDDIEGRLIVRGCHAPITSGERARVERIEEGLRHG